MRQPTDGHAWTRDVLAVGLSMLGDGKERPGPEGWCVKPSGPDSSPPADVAVRLDRQG
ncbi:MAG: hypothetical protein KDJ70_18850 [Candidatus Competibacteraceae bacterium]|nr:hypothetical protein [Candidatus Competibacteraceae bacterium]